MQAPGTEGQIQGTPPVSNRAEGTVLKAMWPAGTACIGSDCMAWRWADEIERRWTAEPPEGEGWQRVEAIGGVAHYARTHKTPHGYCGLAGAPQ